VAWQRTAWRKAAVAAGALALAVPALAYAHERWVRQVWKPFDVAYFRSMTGEVLRTSLTAAIAVAGVVAAWYLVAVPVCEKITPHGPEAVAREARLPLLARWSRAVGRFVLDADVDTPLMARGERWAARVFQRIPAAVLMLGAFSGWIVMPSFPAHGQVGQVVCYAQIALAAWILAGVRLRELGIATFLVFAYLIVEFREVAVDAIPVLASAFFWFFARDPDVVNPRQIAGIRVSLGVGFFLLGLINKIFYARLFIAVGDAYPQLLEGPRQMFPGLTREAWSFGTGLGEMTFGLLLLLGLFDKLTTLALTLIFANFVIVFGWAEIVHIYPICGFLVLFFHAPPGTVLDGAVFRAHVKLWHASGHSGSSALFPIAVGLVALAAATLLFFLPLLLFVHVIPRL
jgi:uncharacterized membrane protein YphA (DoxX/SURF4 family)